MMQTVTTEGTALYFDLGALLPSSGAVGHLAWNAENPAEVEVRLDGVLGPEDAQTLEALLEIVKDCLSASRSEWRAERLIREAGFTRVNA